MDPDTYLGANWYRVTPTYQSPSAGEVKTDSRLAWSEESWDVDELRDELKRRIEINQVEVVDVTVTPEWPSRTAMSEPGVVSIDDLLFNPQNRRNLSLEEGITLFDRSARRLLGIAGTEFLARYDSGVYQNTDTPAVTKLHMMLPFVRSAAA